MVNPKCHPWVENSSNCTTFHMHDNLLPTCSLKFHNWYHTNPNMMPGVFNVKSLLVNYHQHATPLFKRLQSKFSFGRYFYVIQFCRQINSGTDCCCHIIFHSEVVRVGPSIIIYHNVISHHR